MKHFWTLLALFLSLHSFSQDVINDTFSMEPGYANMVFYNMSEGPAIEIHVFNYMIEGPAIEIQVFY